MNHLGFKQPEDVLLLNDATPHNKDYKYIYMATLYCIATQDVNPATCKTMDLFPVELMNHIHAIFNTTARKIKESYCQILMYQERMDNNTITNYERTCVEILMKKMNHLGFKQPGDVLLLNDTTPHDKDYKYIYTVTLYCIITQDVNPSTCKTTDIFPIKLMNNMHTVFDTAGINQATNLYHNLTYNAFALHIIKIATAKWKETKTSKVLPELLDCPLPKFDRVEVNNYTGHNINMVNVLN
jgi:hypothetical protein